MPLNFDDNHSVVDLLLQSEESPGNSSLNSESILLNYNNKVDETDDMKNDNINVTEIHSDNHNITSGIFDLDSTALKDSASSKVTHDEMNKKYDTFSTINESEDDFDKSSDKASLFDTLNSLGKKQGWEQKVQDFAKKSIKDKNIAENTDIEEFQEYVTDVTNYGIKSLPQAMTNEIKEKVSNFVKTRLNPINEAYKEALIQAGERSIDPIKNIMSQINCDKPSSSKVVITLELKIETQDKMAHVKPNVSESFTETIVGQGNYHEEDFSTILKNDVKMSLFGDPDYNSDEESGLMPLDEEVHLVSKLEKEAERQIRIQNDFREALNPNIGLELNSMFSDHKHIMDTIARLRSDDIEIYNNSIVANHDTTLPPPEVLTYKYKGRIYKLVTVFQWRYLDNNIHLPLDQRQKRVNKIQKFYLHLPPPMLPMRKRLFNVMEIPASCSPTKITKSALNLAFGGVKIGKNISPNSQSLLNTTEIPGIPEVKDPNQDSDGDHSTP
uniref:Uncharacterized protein n=2 Tax=Panagrolaimus sp. PS1159 TaxID=55785 RepID=A0AC35FK00_9BILA